MSAVNHVPAPEDLDILQISSALFSELHGEIVNYASRGHDIEAYYAHNYGLGRWDDIDPEATVGKSNVLCLDNNNTRVNLWWSALGESAGTVESHPLAGHAGKVIANGSIQFWKLPRGHGTGIYEVNYEIYENGLVKGYKANLFADTISSELIELAGEYGVDPSCFTETVDQWFLDDDEARVLLDGLKRLE